MKHTMYSVFDAAAAAYLPPFLAQTDAVATRMFTGAVLDEAHQFHKHAEDYTLFAIADFYDEDAQIIPFDNHTKIASAHEVLARFNAFVTKDESETGAEDNGE